jgi:hypothetical protein
MRYSMVGKENINETVSRLIAARLKPETEMTLKEAIGILLREVEDDIEHVVWDEGIGGKKYPYGKTVKRQPLYGAVCIAHQYLEQADGT